LSRNLGTLTSWNPLGHSRPVAGVLKLNKPGEIKVHFTLKHTMKVKRGRRNKPLDGGRRSTTQSQCFTTPPQE